MNATGGFGGVDGMPLDRSNVMRDRPWVAYVGPFLFPWGQPGSRRVYGIAKALACAGRTVVVAGGGEQPTTVESLEHVGSGEILHSGTGELAPHRSVVVKGFRALVLQGARAIRWLDAQPTLPSHVVIYGAHAPFMARVSGWARGRRVPVVADVVEWYDPSHVAGGRFGPMSLSLATTMHWYYPRCAGIIAISSLLERHFAARGLPVVRVPPTLDVRAAPFREAPPTDEGRLRLIYAGSPGKKDLLATIVRALSLVDPGGTRIELDVLGATHAQVGALLGDPAAVPSGVRCLGRVPQPRVADAYLEADFSVLLREPLRFAHAGFPTKVPESLACGVPVICNVTSDLGAHVRDGVNGLLCDDHGEAALATTLRRALALPRTRRVAMRLEARRSCEREFDSTVYAGALDRFLSEVSR